MCIWADLKHLPQLLTRMLNGTLFDVVEDTMRYLIGQIKVAFEIEGMPTQRTEIFEYPLPALREIVLNTIIHRDYLSPIDIQIKIFDQEITFYNPGTLYGNLTVEELKKDNYQANARNKLLAEAFYLTGDIEKYGSGFIRIRKEIKEYPTMKMEFNEIPNGFLASLSYTKQKTSLAEIDGGVNGGVSGGVSGGVNDILLLIENNPGINVSNIKSLLNIPQRTIERWINQLKKENKIEFKGAPKTGGYWKIEK